MDFEVSVFLLGYKGEHVTAHYAVPEIEALIVAVQNVCGDLPCLSFGDASKHRPFYRALSIKARGGDNARGGFFGALRRV